MRPAAEDFFVPIQNQPIRFLAASHRLLRAQRYEGADMVTHFSTFALCSAGRDSGDLSFELSAFRLHIHFYLRALRAFLGSGVPLKLAVTDFAGASRHLQLETQLLSPIGSAFERVECNMDDSRTTGKGYYLDLCFHIYGIDSSGRQRELADGGSVDWTQRLLSNAKERLVISGIGSERVCSAF